jgi:hypothetical protein
MKKYFYVLFFITSLFTTIVQANTITVKGRILLSNGSAAKSTQVNIAVYLANISTSCSEQLVMTNGDGTYSKEISCTGGDIRRARISVKNCDGQTMIQDKDVPTSKIVEANFTSCVPAVPPVQVVSCSANYTYSRLGPKKFSFNSNVSVINVNDNIVSRIWNFGDGTTSRDISPQHEFLTTGNYEVCVNIKTSKGCESHLCMLIKVDGNVVTNNDPIIIVSLYPVPVHENLQTIVYSKNSNTLATILILNVDGIIQPIQKVVTLSQGNNLLTLNVSELMAGSYFYKVRTQYGVQSKSFYKL